MMWYTVWNVTQRSVFSSPLWISYKARRYGTDFITSKVRAVHSQNCMDKQSSFKLCNASSECARNILIQRVSLNTSPLEVNTDVVKDVILYRYDNPRFFRNLNFFAICQFVFWAYLSHFAYTTLKDAPVPKGEDENVPWWRRINLGENKFRNILTATSFLIGYGILAAAWMYTLKSVRYIILRKGGKQVTFITYTPYGHNRMFTADLSKVFSGLQPGVFHHSIHHPDDGRDVRSRNVDDYTSLTWLESREHLEYVSSQESRQNARVHLPIKVKNLAFHYIIDMKGEFKNPALFDLTVGLHRQWKKK